MRFEIDIIYSIFIVAGKWFDSLFELFYFTFFFSLSFIIYALYNEEIQKVTKKKKRIKEKKNIAYFHMKL